MSSHGFSRTADIPCRPPAALGVVLPGVPLAIAAALAWQRVPALAGTLAVLAGGMFAAVAGVRCLALADATLRIGPGTWQIGAGAGFEAVSLAAGWVAFDRVAALRFRWPSGRHVTVYLARGACRSPAWRKLRVCLALG